MMEKKEMICISCPVGCVLQVWEDNGKIMVEGNACKRGETYGVLEYSQPVRMVTSIVRMEDSNRPVPVRLSRAVPKELIADVLKEIAKARAKEGARRHDIIVKNIAGSGADLILTADA
ncbi:MAG: DUF1667 domain-containing protein [Christensenellales bacterium]|jgi:CxxC motif-containing protein